MWEGRGGYRVLVGKHRERNHLEDPGVDGRIILKMGFLEVGSEGMDRIDVAQDRDRWQPLVYTVMKLQVP
jgi:hypothetical protein